MSTRHSTAPLSPKSIRWYCHDDDDLHYSGLKDRNQPLSDAWQIPNPGEMKRRLAVRRGIAEETLQHRRIHLHRNGARNIAHVLMQREYHGARRDSRQIMMGRVARVSMGSSSSSTSTSSETSTATTTSAGRPLLDEIRSFAEHCSVVRYHSSFLTHLGQLDSGQLPPSSEAISTISIAFSPDAQTMASTHGDHTVKITSCASGHLLQSLEGHPRTPWTVKYHPLDSKIVASGCLGHQVRLWNWEQGLCLRMIRLEFAIISLSFHPTGKVLAIANGTRLHFWSLENAYPKENEPTSPTQQQQQQQNSPQRRQTLTEIEQRHMLRCVHFPPNGSTIIVGGVNPTTDANRPRRGGISGGGMSFYLRLWDFDLQAALRPGETHMGLRRRAISNPRTFVPRALLYNDGGFDVSPDGKTLCACAEYWLPDGCSNAMDLMRTQQQEMVDSDEESIDGQGRMALNNDGGAPMDTDAPSSGSAVPSSAINGSATETRTRIEVSPPRSGAARHNSSQVQEQRPRVTTTPQTPPPTQTRPNLTLSPPSPPGRRFTGGLGQSTTSRIEGESAASGQGYAAASSGASASAPPPPPPPPGVTTRPLNQSAFARIQRPGNGLPSNYADPSTQLGRYVPHVVTISLDTSPVLNDLVPGRNPANVAGGGPGSTGGLPNKPQPRHQRPRLGQLLEACPLDGAKASAVTCVKFSPSTEFCLIGYGVREPLVEAHAGTGSTPYHPVTALYRIKGGMRHVSTMLSGDDDVNIARFHPESGYGFVYGTKQGRVRVLSPRPWNFYNC